jgi:hypothetical protein
VDEGAEVLKVAMERGSCVGDNAETAGPGPATSPNFYKKIFYEDRCNRIAININVESCMIVVK